MKLINVLQNRNYKNYKEKISRIFPKQKKVKVKEVQKKSVKVKEVQKKVKNK